MWLPQKLCAIFVNFKPYKFPTQVDGHRTVKFVFVINQPDSLSVMQKARIGTQNGAISEFFRV